MSEKTDAAVAEGKGDVEQTKAQFQETSQGLANQLTTAIGSGIAIVQVILLLLKIRQVADSDIGTRTSFRRQRQSSKLRWIDTTRDRSCCFERYELCI